MPEINSFDEASAATQELFNAAPEEEQTEETAPEEEQEQTEQEVPEEQDIPKEAEKTLDEAVQTAEIAAQTAVEKDEQLQQVMNELAAARQQIQQMQGTIEEISKQNAENIVEEALQPPTLDIAGLAFESDEEQKAAMAKYAEEMSAYNRQELLKELAPTLEYAKRGMQDAQKADAIEVLAQVPELAGIKEALPNLDKIIANNKWLQSDEMPLDEKYINAFAILKGIDSINHPVVPTEPKEPTADELMALYEKNPEFQELIEKKRLDAVKGSQQVPPFSASSGAAGAALDIKEKPQNLEEARERTKKMFGLS